MVCDISSFVVQGANINAETRDGLTPAYFSAVCGHSTYLKELIKQGTDINRKYKEPQRTLLHYAAEAGQERVLKTLLRRGAETEIHAGPRFFTPLHLAARLGHERGVELLLKYGANVEALSLKGYTPLHHTARCGKHEIGKLLVASGANVDAISGKLFSQLHPIVNPPGVLLGIFGECRPFLQILTGGGGGEEKGFFDEDIAMPGNKAFIGVKFSDYIAAERS